MTKRSLSLAKRVSRKAKPVRDAIELIASSCTPDESLINEIMIFSPEQKLGQHIESSNVRFASMLVNIFVITSIQIGELVGLREATLKFFGSRQDLAESVFALIPLDTLSKAENLLSCLAFDQEFEELYPYILDPHGDSYRLDVIRDPGKIGSRRARKVHGVFYTPRDVAKFMIKECIGGKIDGKMLDPACGSGIFIVEAMNNYFDKNQNKEALDYFSERFFGIDISVLAVENCAFNILHSIVNNTAARDAIDLYESWLIVRRNLICADAIRIDKTSNLFAVHGENVEFEYLIVNPPYATYYIDQNYRYKWSIIDPGDKAIEASLVFVEMMSSFTTKNGKAIAVLPLSIAYHSGNKFLSTRRAIIRSRMFWKFWFFDREPSALFGEEAKTRNTVILLDKARSGGIHTSRMLKWLNEERSSLFETNRTIEIDYEDPRCPIYKIDSLDEIILIKSMNKALSEKSMIVESSSELIRYAKYDPLALYVSGTAYNFVNVFLYSIFEDHEAANLSQSPVHRFTFESEKARNAAFAVISSRMFYWWWRVISDGFHVSKGNIKDFMLFNTVFDKQLLDSLGENGEKIWEDSKNSPLKSINGGSVSIAYRPDYNSESVRNAERIILNHLDLHDADRYLNFFEGYINENVNIGGKVRRI